MNMTSRISDHSDLGATADIEESLELDTRGVKPKNLEGFSTPAIIWFMIVDEVPRRPNNRFFIRP
jgi:hypothetical protein